MTLPTLTHRTPDVMRDIRNNLLADFVRPGLVQRARAMQDGTYQAPAPISPPLFKDNRGTPNAELRAMPDAALQARFAQLAAFLSRWNLTPRAVRGPMDEAARKLDRIAACEQRRIEGIAKVRNLVLVRPSLGQRMKFAEDQLPSREPVKGDCVEVEFRNPATGEVEQGSGTFVRTEQGKWAVIYIICVNGREYSMSKRNILQVKR